VTGIDRRGAVLGGLALPFAALPPAALSPAELPARAAPRPTGARPGPYMLGADVTWIAEDEAAGATYLDRRGRQRDPLAILADAGFNWIRLRVFADPARGYSAGDPAAAWGGIEQAARLGARVKDAGMKLALSFHYSDTWADPEHQGVPAGWTDRSPAGLARAVREHTRAGLIAMRRGRAPVDMAVIGNEITFGMLWPHGQVALSTPTGNPQTDARDRHVPGMGGFDALATFLRAGIAGAREAEPGVTIQLHNHLGRHWSIVREWTDALVARGVGFDAIGLSCYQQREQGDWARTFAGFAERYPTKGVIAAEYSSRKRYLNDLLHELPGDRGWGSFIWEPTRHQEAVFDANGRNAGGGPKPDLLRDGVNTAEAPGADQASRPANAPPRRGVGGPYRANVLLEEYGRMALAYGLRRG